MQNALTEAVAFTNDPEETRNQIDQKAAALEETINALTEAEPGGGSEGETPGEETPGGNTQIGNKPNGNS